MRPTTTDRDDRERGARLREHPEQDPGVASSGRSAASSPRTSRTSPGARLDVIQAFVSWSRTTTPIASAANRTHRPARDAARPAPAGAGASSSTISSSLRTSSGVVLEPGRPPGAPRRGPSSGAAGVADTPEGDPRLAGLELHDGRRSPRPGRDRGGSRRPASRRRRSPRYGPRPRGRGPSTQSSIRSSSSSSASLRRSWIARWSSRASPSARSSGVRVVSMTTTRPSSWATAVPGRGVAWISTSSGRQGHAGERSPNRRRGSRTGPRGRPP